jgi:hypothetical protein
MPSLLAVGLNDGTVAVYDVRAEQTDAPPVLASACVELGWCLCCGFGAESLCLSPSMSLLLTHTHSLSQSWCGQACRSSGPSAVDRT